jgi:hypothetical protein
MTACSMLWIDDNDLYVEMLHKRLVDIAHDTSEGQLDRATLYFIFCDGAAFSSFAPALISITCTVLRSDNIIMHTSSIQ